MNLRGGQAPWYHRSSGAASAVENKSRRFSSSGLLPWFCGPLALVLDVTGQGTVAASLPHGRDVEATCPELAAPQLLLEFGQGAQHLHGRDALVNPHDLAGGDLGRSRTQQVDVVEVGTQRLDLELAALGGEDETTETKR